MIKIIEPSQYKSIFSEENKNNKSQTEFQIQEQSEDDSDMQIQVVNTEQKGNEIVYKITNYALILFAVFIMVVYYIEIHHSQTILINNVEHIEIYTMYETQIEGKKTQVTLFLPNKNIHQPNQIEQNAEFCQKYHSNDCSREILLARKYLFIEIQKTLIKYPRSNGKNILVFWEQRLSLAIILLNLNKQQKVWIDVIINEQDSPIYIQSFRYNLQRYQLDNYVRIMRQMQVNSQFISRYSLVLGKNDILDKIIHPQLLQKAVLQGKQELSSGIIYNFILHTNLLIYYHQVTNESLAILQGLANQVIAIKANQRQEVKESVLDKFNQTFRVILLDGRKKITKRKQQQPKESIDQQEMGQVQNLEDEQLQPLLMPLLQIHRIEPQKLINFFKCPQNTNETLGQYYKSELRDLLINKAYKVEQYETHLYNFIYHYLLSVNPCNILYTMNNQILANIALMANAGQFYLPINLNQNSINIEASLQANSLMKNYHQIVLESSSLQSFLYDSQISLILTTVELFQQQYHRFTWALDLNINIVMKYEGGKSTGIISKIIQNYYVFAIFQRQSRQFDKKCIKDFDFEYYQDKTYPKSTYLLISKTHIDIQEINPKYYSPNKLQRNIRYKKHQCYRNFDLVNPSEKSNLKRQQILLRVNNKVNLILQSKNNYKQSVKRTKQQQGITMFLKNSLIVSDNLLIYSQNQPSLFLMINMLNSIPLGQSYFADLDQQRIANIQRHTEMNDLNNNYQFINQKIQNLQGFVANNKITVLFLSPSTMKESHQIIPKLKKGTMVFFNYDIKDFQLEQLLKKYLSSLKLFQITNKPDEKGINNLCLSYHLNEIINFNGLPENTWIVMIIKSFY